MASVRAISLVLVAQVLLHSVNGGPIQVTAQNYEGLITSTDVVLLNFYADWCRFSQQLKPIFEKAAVTMANENTEARVVFGKVNCETDKDLCLNTFHVSKYPTLKLVRYQQVARREYRGRRSVDALIDYVKDQLKNPIELLTDFYDADSQKKTAKKAHVGFFPTNTSHEYDSFRKVATNLRDDCPFFAVLGQEKSQILFREEERSDAVFVGDLTNLPSMFMWARKNCIPLVREITFQNGEELTEEGIPLLILFYHPDEPSIKELFRTKVAEELEEFKGTITAVTADGKLFAHPLHHLGKGTADLPLLAIDSFRHMYVFPNFQDINISGKLKAFVADLHSGKLHREFHHGPDPTNNAPSTPNTSSPPNKRSVQAPPESTFRKLRPDTSRYTLLRDEL